MFRSKEFPKMCVAVQYISKSSINSLHLLHCVKSVMPRGIKSRILLPECLTPPPVARAYMLEFFLELATKMHTAAAVCSTSHLRTKCVMRLLPALMRYEKCII